MDEWLRSLSGDWGPPLFDLYSRNSLWINTIVVVYGGLLLLSWQNLRRMRDFLRADVAHQIGKRGEKIDEDKLFIPWEQALNVSRFPLVAAEWGFLPRRTSVETLQALLPRKDLLPQPERSVPKLKIKRNRASKPR